MKTFEGPPWLIHILTATVSGTLALMGAGCEVSSHTNSSGCGIGVATQGDGQEALVDHALGNAGLNPGSVFGYEHAIAETEAIWPNLQPGERIRVVVQDGAITSVEKVTEIVASCTELEQLKQSSAPSPEAAVPIAGTAP